MKPLDITGWRLKFAYSWSKMVTMSDDGRDVIVERNGHAPEIAGNLDEVAAQLDALAHPAFQGVRRTLYCNPLAKHIDTVELNPYWMDCAVQVDFDHPVPFNPEAMDQELRTLEHQRPFRFGFYIDRSNNAIKDFAARVDGMKVLQYWQLQTDERCFLPERGNDILLNYKFHHRTFGNPFGGDIDLSPVKGLFGDWYQSPANRDGNIVNIIGTQSFAQPITEVEEAIYQFNAEVIPATLATADRYAREGAPGFFRECIARHAAEKGQGITAEDAIQYIAPWECNNNLPQWTVTGAWLDETTHTYFRPTNLRTDDLVDRVIQARAEQPRVYMIVALDTHGNLLLN
ncbi:hypothetical protein AUJ68_06330 [Candidatus Woesearchaeota archaeon CG1_02_57_44]|nr:MAG: hypothetical protein AUJ68_06330 [Candidatus Woesearchaeota archaeon CG1_02_57_44]PIN71014.1 MAG: hypothetical protein COV94_00040 [Candidatus Woesearchaeota archaeon CG11_big_fil_rev_8_21_14_0_20_57_5]